MILNRKLTNAFWNEKHEIFKQIENTIVNVDSSLPIQKQSEAPELDASLRERESTCTTFDV